MATRVGQFSGPTFEWTAPLSSVHPINNIISGSQFHELLNKETGLTEEEIRDLEDQIRELEAVMRIDRSWRDDTA